jgi:hypothetical protein
MSNEKYKVGSSRVKGESKKVNCGVMGEFVNIFTFCK